MKFFTGVPTLSDNITHIATLEHVKIRNDMTRNFSSSIIPENTNMTHRTLILTLMRLVIVITPDLSLRK